MSTKFKINGKAVVAQSEPDTPRLLVSHNHSHPLQKA